MIRNLSIFLVALAIGLIAPAVWRQMDEFGTASSFSLASTAFAKNIRAENRKLVDDFLKIWMSPMSPTVLHNRWLGVKTLQNPNDMWITQEILFEVKPDFLVEAGAYHGGSAVVWAMILEQINPDARVITIDIEDHLEDAKKLDIFQRKVDFLLGSSTDPAIIAEVKRRTAGKKVVVLLDSAHNRDHVLQELRAYSPMVGVGSYLIVQDTIVNGHPVWPEYGPGPYEAVEAFLAENDQFKPDRSRERLLVTLCRKGYLERIR